MRAILAIAAAGALGSVVRYGLGRLIQSHLGRGLPIGTLAVNVAGCFLVGIIARYFVNNETHPVVQAALIVGFCGGFTTYSAFSLETIGLVSGGAWVKAVAYVSLTTVLSLAATAVGYLMVLRR